MRFAHCLLQTPKGREGQGPAISIAGIGLSFQGPRGGSGAVPRGAFSRRGPLPCQKQFLEKGATRHRNAVLTGTSGHTYSHRPAIGVSVQGFRPFLGFERPLRGKRRWSRGSWAPSSSRRRGGRRTCGWSPKLVVMDVAERTRRGRRNEGDTSLSSDGLSTTGLAPLWARHPHCTGVTAGSCRSHSGLRHCNAAPGSANQCASGSRTRVTSSPPSRRTR
jgi:hypothetical protein